MIAIIDSGGANIASVRFALERLGVDSVLTADPAVISAAERVILPGVGAAPVAMAQLARAGLVECIRESDAACSGHLSWHAASVRTFGGGRHAASGTCRRHLRCL